MANEIQEGRLRFHGHGDYFIVGLSSRNEYEGTHRFVGFRVKGPQGYARDFTADEIEEAKADCEARFAVKAVTGMPGTQGRRP